MRILIALAVIQSAAIAGLAMKILHFEEHVQATNKQVRLIITNTENILGNIKTTSSDMVAFNQQKEIDPYTPSLEVFRAVLRMELARAQINSATLSKSQVPPAITQTSQEQKNQRLMVDSTIGRHIADGSINDGDMAKLQSEIAKLSVDDRHRALSRITKAMNAGDLKGAL